MKKEQKYIVEIGFDYKDRRKRFENLPIKDICKHKFYSVLDLNNYLQVVNEVSNDGLGTFLYNVKTI